MTLFRRFAAMALVLAAGLSLAGLPLQADAARKKKEEPAAEENQPDYSKEFRKNAGPVQKSVTEQNWPEVLTGVAELEKLPELNDDDWRVILNWKLQAQQSTGDSDGLMETLLAWMERGYATPEQTVQFNQNLAAYYSQKGDAEKTLQYYKAFIEANPDPEPQEIAVLGRLYLQRDDNAQAKEWLDKAIARAEELGQQPDELYFQLLDRVYVQMQDGERRLSNLEELAKRYPKGDYYSRILAIYGQGSEEDRLLMLNAYRLAMLDTGLSTVGEYLGYADRALVLGSPGEAMRAMEQGMAAGIVPSAGSNQEIVQEAKAAVARDRRDLPKDAQAAAKDPKGEFDVKVGLGFYSLGEWEKTVEAVKRGLAKGGVKRQDDANMLLGAALVQLGRYDEAKQAFAAAAAVAGSNDFMRRLAGLWTAYADRKAGGDGAG